MKINKQLLLSALLFSPIVGAETFDEMATKSLHGGRYTVHIYCKFREADKYQLLARVKRTPVINFKRFEGTGYMACRARVRNDTTGIWSVYTDMQVKNPLHVIPWDVLPEPAEPIAPAAPIDVPVQPGQ